MKFGHFNTLARYYSYDFAAKKGYILVAAAVYTLSLICVLFGQKSKQLKLLLFAHRLTFNNFLTKQISRNMPFEREVMDNLVSNADFSIQGVASRIIILKNPSYINEELSSKGILLITFTHVFSYFFHHINIPELLSNYHVVLEPSSAGYADPDILFWTAYKEPVIIQSTEIKDREFISGLNCNLKPVSFGASDWVDNRLFTDVHNKEKIYDAIYIANLNPVKRLHIYLRSIQKIKQSGEKVNAALVVASWGGDKNILENLLDYYQVRDSVTCFNDLSHKEINNLFNQSTVSVLLSLKEGSNRALFESIFSNTPIIALRNNIGINKDYVNNETGVLIADHELAKTILDFKYGNYEYSPRAWAMANIAPEVTIKKLVSCLNSLNKSEKIDLHEVATKINSPEVTYFDLKDKKIIYSSLEVLNQFKLE